MPPLTCRRRYASVIAVAGSRAPTFFAITDLAADPIKRQIGTFSIRQLLHLLGQRLFGQATM